MSIIRVLILCGIAGALGALIGWTTTEDVPIAASTVAADDHGAAPVSNSCRQDNCGSGCSVSCPASQRAVCVCLKRPILCPQFWTPPCYEDVPSCTCQ
ncbi:hypothetical protein HY480_02495 [Candidatus Uhrbacteria bacterium]|nr:hypothetical protein [Candidatus Uhrbacteria bacterium]